MLLCNQLSTAEVWKCLVPFSIYMYWKHFSLLPMCFESSALSPNGSFHLPSDIIYMDSRSPHRCLDLYWSLLIALLITRVHKLSRCREVERFWYNGKLYIVSSKEWGCHSDPPHAWTSWFLIMSQHLGMCSVSTCTLGNTWENNCLLSNAVEISPIVAT